MTKEEFNKNVFEFIQNNLSFSILEDKLGGLNFKLYLYNPTTDTTETINEETINEYYFAKCRTYDE